MSADALKDTTAASAAREAIPVSQAVDRAVDQLIHGRGMVRIIAADPGEVLRRVGHGLPASFHWSAVVAPQSAAAVRAELIGSGSATEADTGGRLRETLWRRARAGLNTVLGVAETTATPAEVLNLLDELAGMEPMLQIVLVSEPEAADRDHAAAARLVRRVRVRIVAAVDDATGAKPEPKEPGQGSTPAGRRPFDPFRGSYVSPGLDSPELLPVLSDPHGPHAEAFRMLRMRLENWVRGRGGGSRAIAISSAESEAGKTFVAVNLALLWATSTFERVLLVDGDLRRPQLHALFELPQRPGLADVLAGRCHARQAVRFVPDVGLHVMPAGRAGNPRRLVNPDRVQHALEAVRRSYDIAILDGPPLPGVVDGHSFPAACDGTLIVARAGRTRRDDLQGAVAELPPDRVIGVVVNGQIEAERGARSRYAADARG